MRPEGTLTLCEVKEYLREHLSLTVRDPKPFFPSNDRVVTLKLEGEVIAESRFDVKQVRDSNYY